MAIVVPGKDYTKSWNALADVFGNYTQLRENAYQRQRQQTADAQNLAYHKERLRNATLLGDQRAYDLAQAKARDEEIAANEMSDEEWMDALRTRQGTMRVDVPPMGIQSGPFKDIAEPGFDFKRDATEDEKLQAQYRISSQDRNQVLNLATLNTDLRNAQLHIGALKKQKIDIINADLNTDIKDAQVKKINGQIKLAEDKHESLVREAEAKANSAEIKQKEAELEQIGAREQQILSNKAIGHYAYPTETVVGPDLQDQMGFVGGRRGITPYESESAYRNFVAGGIGREPGELTDPQEELRKKYLKQSYERYPALAKQTWGEPNVADIVSGRVTYTFAPEGKNPVSSANRQEKTLTKLFGAHIDTANEAAKKATGTSWEASDIVAITEAEGNQMINAILMAASQLSREGGGFADVIASDIMAEPGYYANIINATDPDMVLDDPYKDYTPMKASKIVKLYKDRNKEQKSTIDQGQTTQRAQASVPSKEDFDALWEEVQKTNPGQFKSREELVTKILNNIRAEQ